MSASELIAAVLGWQIVEGLRLLLTDLHLDIPKINLLVDNQAAITIATCGSNWRTRYFGVRGHRLHQECQRDAVTIEHCKTGDMIVDSLTKIATAPVIAVLHAAMNGRMPPHSVSTSPGRKIVAMRQVMVLRPRPFILIVCPLSPGPKLDFSSQSFCGGAVLSTQPLALMPCHAATVTTTATAKSRS